MFFDEDANLWDKATRKYNKNVDREFNWYNSILFIKFIRSYCNLAECSFVILH